MHAGNIFAWNSDPQGTIYLRPGADGRDINIGALPLFGMRNGVVRDQSFVTPVECPAIEMGLNLRFVPTANPSSDATVSIDAVEVWEVPVGRKETDEPFKVLDRNLVVVVFNAKTKLG